MKQLRKYFAGGFVLLLLLALCGCGSPQNRMQKQFDRFLKSSFTSFLKSDALSAHTFYTKSNVYSSREKSNNAGLGFRPSQESFAKIREENQSEQKELKKIDRSLLKEQQQVDYDLYLFQLQREETLYQEKFDYYHSFFNSANGIHTQLPVLFTELRVMNEDDLKLLLSLLQDSGDFLNAYTGYAQGQSARATFIGGCSEIAEYCRSVAEAGANSPVLKSSLDKLEALGIAEVSKQEYTAQITQAVQQILLPAYERLASAMEALEGKEQAASLAVLPEGKAYYEALFQNQLGTSATVTEWKQRLTDFCDGQKQRLADVITAQQGLETSLLSGTFQTGYESYEAIMEALNQAICADFPDIGDISYTIGDIPQSIASDGVAAYFCVPPLDSELPRTIKVNKETAGEELGSVSLFQLLAHEGLPGHMYQNAYAAQALSDKPWRLSMLQFEGYTEGYAVYTQLHAVTYLPIESGTASVYQAVQLIQFTVTALMEMGVHYEGWTMAQAEEFLKAYGMEDTEGRLYNSLANAPGVFTPYYAGAAEFFRLRHMAEKQLEGRFDLKQFHTALLQYGKVPFDFLSEHLVNDLGLDALQAGSILSLQIDNRTALNGCPVIFYLISIPARRAC